ncbi:MAG: TetR/AcrR family transcriptional regulator [Clostridiaceae bacterium]
MSAEEQAKRKNDLVKNGFIQAAKNIILAEGVTAVSVRKIALETGYSYATIYHYFADLNALLVAVKENMVEDVAAHLTSANAAQFRSVADLKQINRTYAQYYLDRPHVYDFFYSYRFKTGENTSYDLRFQQGWFAAYDAFVQNSLLRSEDVVTAAKTMIYVIQGLLALYFSSNGLTKDAFFQELDNAADYLFQNRREI